jgi:hypothetical protein
MKTEKRTNIAASHRAKLLALAHARKEDSNFSSAVGQRFQSLGKVCKTFVGVRFPPPRLQHFASRYLQELGFLLHVPSPSIMLDLWKSCGFDRDRTDKTAATRVKALRKCWELGG